MHKAAICSKISLPAHDEPGEACRKIERVAESLTVGAAGQQRAVRRHSFVKRRALVPDGFVRRAVVDGNQADVVI